MARVLIERPRGGDRFGYRRQRTRNRRANLEDAHRREAQRDKSQSDLFGPLRRFLRTNVGRPWNKVFAEICRHARLENVTQQHLRRHVEDFVAIHVVEMNGVLHHQHRRGSEFLPLKNDQLYVCSETGLLRVHQKTPDDVTCMTARTRARTRDGLDEFLHGWRVITAQFHKIGGKWFFVEVLPVGKGSDRRYDALLRRVLSEIDEAERTATYRFDAYATSVRPTTKMEQKEIARRMKVERQKQNRQPRW